MISRPELPPAERPRAEQQALRLRMLNGEWSQDLEAALAKHISSDRRTAWGIPEMSRNPFRSISTQVGGALYQSPPTTMGGDKELLSRVDDSGYWQLMQRVSTDLVGVREALVRKDYSERGGLLSRPVAPDLVVIRAVPEAPDVPAAVEEMQIRTHPKTKKPAWCWEIIDVTDLDHPRHEILSGNRKEDWTGDLLGGPRSEGNFLYRGMDGAPFYPGVLYHAERTGRLWDPFYGIEAVLGSLTVGVLLTFWVHGVKDGSFATVLLVNGRVAGLEITDPSGTRTQVISAEPGSLIEVAPIQDDLQPSVIQLQPGFDPEKLMSAIGMFEGGLAQYAGVSNADLLRTGADPRSGASLSISREGLRAAQARHAPLLRRGDLQAISIDARILNRATGTRYAEAGYSISYPALPLSESEVKSQREDILAKTSAGLMSKVDAYIRLHPGLSREDAITELQRIARENAMFPSSTPVPFIP